MGRTFYKVYQDSPRENIEEIIKLTSLPRFLGEEENEEIIAKVSKE
jgi:topoisomerase IA-like protein